MNSVVNPSAPTNITPVNFTKPGTCPAFILPALLFVISALLILAVGLLLSTGLERRTARSYIELQRAELAASAALQQVKASLNHATANDSFLLLQSTLKPPVQSTRQATPYVLLAQGRPAPNDSLSFSYLPLFSATEKPPNTPTLTPPPIEPLIPTAAGSYLDLTPLPYGESLRLAWIPILNSQQQLVARYAFWVEDLQGKLDPLTTGNADGPAASQLASAWPFPAPAMDPDPTHPPLSPLALHAVDPESTAAKPGKLAQTLIANRKGMISPDSLLAAADAQAPLSRDPAGHLTDKAARAVEENLATTPRPYLERPCVPFVRGLAAAVLGTPKLNLNALLAKGSGGVAPMAAFIQQALPEFDTRKGGFPDDYLQTLAANAIDYADADSQSTLLAGSYRGLDAFPLISEVVLQIHYIGEQEVNGRRILNWHFKLFAELWNMTNLDVSGSARLSYEVALPMDGIGAATPSKRFDDPALLDDPAKTSHHLTKIAGRYWSPEIAVGMLANEYKTYEAAEVTYALDVGPSSSLVANHFSLTEPIGAAGISLLWNGQQVDRAAAIIRQKTGLAFDLSDPRYASKATVAALSFGAYGFAIDNPGDPRISYYMRGTQLGENAYPENSSPNRRNIRRSTIYDADSPRKPKTYGRVLPSEWPDGGHDSAVGSWPLSHSDQVTPTDPQYDWDQHPVASQAPQRISNAGRFYSATELGRVYDPILWWPTYDNPQDTASILKGIMPASRCAWPDVLASSPSGNEYGGGNSLRIGRPEHPAFNLPGKRATSLLDLFHAGRSRSPEAAMREGHLVEIRGHVNVNTATWDVLRAMAAGALAQDPALATVPNTLSHQAAPLMAPPSTLTTLYAPSTGTQSEADRIADAIVRSRPLASPSQLALAKDLDGKPVFGNPGMYRPGIHIPNNTRVQWSDAAAEEVFARVYEASTVRSRNFRVWIVGQALSPATSTTATPQVLAEVRKVFTLFADPGLRDSKGAIDPNKSQTVVTHENNF
ncbi:MAG: hypothetical protein DVB26_02535 [Verrucomicrobia bacterium]|nr:MAG: hypothetical protein DVB26_02535 [Verrucomicrobiota bacterium]